MPLNLVLPLNLWYYDTESTQRTVQETIELKFLRAEAAAGFHKFQRQFWKA